MKHVKLFEDFVNEKLSKSEVAQIEKYLDKLDAGVVFDMCNDFYIEDDEWHEIKNDLDQSELVEWALSYIKSNAIKLNDLKSMYESIITEANKLSSKDQKKLKEFAEEVSDEIMDAYEDDFNRKSKNLDADGYTSDSMLEYFLEYIEMNEISVDEFVDEWNWREMTYELGLA